MKTNLQFGMLQTIYTAEEEVKVKIIKVKDKDGNEVEQKEQYSVWAPAPCADKKCGRVVAHDTPCFVDTTTGAIWCDDCGKCERYSRKKAAQRAERAAEREKAAVEEAALKE
jgi:hypothetical protein